MPRLLLVDDNPSIHKIAETLLSRTGIELVCVESAVQALDLIGKGEHFDVALLDTSMSGMDGWGLLDELRRTPATAKLPVAMMAGVLDSVDPTRIQSAPIQGFLKKPVELRDLPDRIQKILETPVEIPEPEAEPPAVVAPAAKSSPFATLPATKLATEFPELRKASGEAAQPSSEVSEDDVLVLTEEDLVLESEPAEVVVAAGPVSIAEPIEAPVPEEFLDLEELDLESLRGLPEPESVVAPVALSAETLPSEELTDLTPPAGFLPPEPVHTPAIPLTLSPAVPADMSAQEDVQAAMVELPDLGPLEEDSLDVARLAEIQVPDAPVAEDITPVETEDLELVSEVPLTEESVVIPPPPFDETLDWSDTSESLLPPVETLVPAPEPLSEEDADLFEKSLTEPDVSLSSTLEEPFEATRTADLDLADYTSSFVGTEAPTPPPVPESSAHLLEPPAKAEAPALAPEPTPEPVVSAPSAPATASVPEAAVLSESSKALLEALLADPVLMDALSKAVVARLGDSVLREIAWEVIPELAERIPVR